MVDTDITEGNVRLLMTKVDPNREMPSILSILPFEKGSQNPSPEHVVSASNLPGIRSRNKKFWDSNSEKGYKEIYDGNMVLVTRIERSQVQGKMSLKIEFGAFREFLERTVKEALIDGGFDELLRIGVPVLTSVCYDEQDGGLDSFDQFDAFFRHLTEDQRHHLSLRVQHLWTVIHAYKLDDQNSKKGFELYEAMVKCLDYVYKEEKMYQEGYELNLGVSSIMHFQMGKSLVCDEVQYHIFEAAKCLDAMKSYKKAASLYDSAGEALIAGDTEESTRLFPALVAAGTSNACAMDSQAAEKAYLKAAYYEQKKPNGSWVNSQNLGLCLTAMVSKYGEWSLMKFSDGLAAKLPPDVWPGITCLVLTANVKCNTAHVKMYLPPWAQPSYLNIMKRQFRTVKAARKLLRSALSSPDDVENFRALVGSCIEAKFVDMSRSFIKTKLPEEIQQQEERKYSKMMKSAGKQFVKKEISGQSPAETGTCDFCTKHMNLSDLKWCPCHTVRYCGRECQIVAWKNGHKDACPHRKANQGKKPAAK